MFGKMLFDFIQALKGIEAETQLLLLRFLIRAGKAPYPNQYVKERIQRILDEDDGKGSAEVFSPRQVRVSSREVKR